MSKDPWHSHQHKFTDWVLIDRRLISNGQVLCKYERYCTTCPHKEYKEEVKKLA